MTWFCLFEYFTYIRNRFHGKYPFAEDTETATIAKVMRGSYALPNDGTCSQNVRSFIKATVTTDPS